MALACQKNWIYKTFVTIFAKIGKINSYAYLGPHWARASTAPMRMFKGFSSDGGLKVPAIISYPGKFEARAGTFTNQLTTVLDLPATFLDIAKTTHPGTSYKGRQVHPYTGVSLLPFLNVHSKPIHEPADVVVCDLNNSRAVRKGDWTLSLRPGSIVSAAW